MASGWRADVPSLHASDGTRKYLNQAECRRLLRAAERLSDEKRLFVLVLAWTGARVSEVLALRPSSFQVEAAVVAIVTLKRRRHSVREVPIPPALMAALETRFRITERQRDLDRAVCRLWPWSRVTAWRFVKDAMERASVVGRHACPRGLRHAFGVGALQAGVPLNLAQRWLGHARISTTAIYAAACGPEEVALAARFWRTMAPLD